MRIPSPMDPPKVKVRTDILKKDYRIGLVSLYFRAVYNDWGAKVASYTSGVNLQGTHENLKYFFPDCLPALGDQFINTLSQNNHFTLLSGDSIIKSQAYLDEKPSKMLYITGNFPGYKIFDTGTAKLAALARKLGVDAVMVVHIFPQSWPIADGITLYTYQYIQVVDQQGQIILSTRLGQRSDYYINPPYTFEKARKLMSNTFELGLADLQKRMDVQYNAKSK